MSLADREMVEEHAVLSALDQPNTTGNKMRKIEEAYETVAKAVQDDFSRLQKVVNWEARRLAHVLPNVSEAFGTLPLDTMVDAVEEYVRYAEQRIAELKDGTSNCRIPQANHRHSCESGCPVDSTGEGRASGAPDSVR